MLMYFFPFFFTFLIAPTGRPKQPMLQRGLSSELMTEHYWPHRSHDSSVRPLRRTEGVAWGVHAATVHFYLYFNTQHLF